MQETASFLFNIAGDLMSTPVIGITTNNKRNEEYKIDLVVTPKAYIKALINAGAIPVLIPLNLPIERLQELLSALDGILVTGGGDIEPEKFNGVDHEQVYGIDLERDLIELQLAKDAVSEEKPFLGICRGLQILNVAFGGDLYTDVADQVPNAVTHRFHPSEHPWDHIAHPVQVDEDSHFAKLVGTPILQVNSLHHQSVKRVADKLIAVAHAPDGVVEALEIRDYPFGLAVQWHPEHLTEDPRMAAIFEAFVEHAGNKA